MDINRDQTEEHHQNTDGLLQPAHAHFTPSTSVPDLELLQHRVKSDPTKVCTTPMLQLGKAAVVVDSVQGGLSANNQTNSNNEFHTHITGSSLMLPLATASSSTSDGTQILDSSGKRRTLTKDSPLHCDICGKKFTRNHQFKCHIMWHTGETPHKCNFCDILFSRKEHLKRHMTLHTGETPFHCNYCSKSFPRKDTMVVHERQHKKETPHLCQNGSKTFTKKCHLVKSIKQIADESPQESTYCLEKTKEKRPIHQNIVESPSQCPKTFSCEFCNHTYKCEEYFISNDLLSSKYNCHKCNNTMPTNEQLFEHVTACHSQNYPHVCEVCKKSFKFKGQLWVHLQIHPTRTFKCDLCSKDFELKYHLVAHRRSHTNPRSSNFIPGNIHDKKKKKWK